jgi:MtN3 and saliva related transmembrane protein
MFASTHFLSWLNAYSEVIGFWAAVLTTVSFAPQVVETWKTAGEGLSWVMLALFGAGTGLWFLYGLLRMSGPLMLANGLTGLQILFLIALKLRFAITSCSEGPQPEATAYTPNKFPPAVLDTWGIGNLSQRVGRGRRSSRDPSEQLWRSNT